MSARGTRGPRSSEVGRTAAIARAVAANGAAFRASLHRTPPRASETTRQRYISASIANAITRPPQPTTSSRCAGRTMARTTPMRRVVTTIAVPRFSDLISRSAATSTRVVPTSPRVAGVRASGAAPPAVCATASRHANAMASMTARVTRRVAIARELDRRTPLQGCERVARDAVHEEVRTDHGRDLIGTDDEDAMVRAAERDRGTSEAVADARRHGHERRAPREPPAFAQEHRLGGADRIGPEPREDLEAASQRARAPAEGGARPLVREVIDAVRHQADLPSGIRRVADELGRCGDHELDRLGVGLDPVLLVRGDVHEEYRVEAGGGLVELRVQLAQSCRGLPMDLLAGVASLMRPHAPESQWVRHEAAPCGRLCERPQRRERAIAAGERRGIRDDLASQRHPVP